MSKAILKNTLTLAQTSKYLNLSLNDIHDLIANGKICSSQDENGQILIDLNCVSTLKNNSSHANEHKSIVDSLTPDDFYGDVDDDSSAVSDQDTLNRLFKSDYLKSDIVTESELVKENELTVYNRESITNYNLTRLIGNIEYTNEKLHDAMYKIGYLESNVASLKAQLEASLTVSHIDTRTIELIKENDLLKAEKDKLVQVKSAYEEKLEKLKKTIFWPFVKNIFD